MRPQLCLILSSQGLEAIRIVASNEKEEAEGEKLLATIQDDLDRLNDKCIFLFGERLAGECV